MSFLAELDVLDAPDGPARAGLFFRHLRDDRRALFAELRGERPILGLQPFAVVSRWADVMDALSRPSTFQVTYRPQMDLSVGPFVLSRRHRPELARQVGDTNAATLGGIAGYHSLRRSDFGYAMIPEAAWHILRLPGIRLLEGDAGRIDNAGGPFAERFVVGFTPETAHD